MSSASAAVLFPDGTIKYGIYSGTSDIMGERLFDTIEAAWEAEKSREPWPPENPDGESEPVVIFSSYGRGFSWPGAATRDRLTDGFDPYGQDGEPAPMVKGEPLWLRWDGAVVVGEVAPREISATPADDYRQFETPFGWDKDRPLTEAEQEDVG